MTSKRKRRELAQLIAQRKQAMQWGPVKQAQSGLMRVLDDLNVFGALEAARKQPPDGLMCFGPKDVFGGKSPAWAGTIIWHRRKGYHNYQTLNVFGVWAIGDAEMPEIIAGTRMLTFTGTHYNPESYFYHMQHDFSVYYGDAVPPPSRPGQLYAVTYERDRRLVLRREVEMIVDSWRGMYAGV